MHHDHPETARPRATTPRGRFTVPIHDASAQRELPRARVAAPPQPVRPSPSVSLDGAPTSAPPGGAATPLLDCLSAQAVIAVAAPIVVATALASRIATGSDWYIAHAAVLAAIAGRVAVRFLSHSIDPRRRDGEWVTDPDRYRYGIAASAVTLVCGLPLLAARGPVVLGVGLVAILAAYAHETGFVARVLRVQTDGFAAFVFTTLGVSAMVVIQVGMWAPEAAIIGLQLGLMASVFPAIRSLRDSGDQQEVAQPTLVDRFGPGFGLYTVALLCLLPYCLGACWLGAGLWGASVLPLLSLPVAIWIVRGVWGRDPGPYYNVFLPRATALCAYFTALVAVGFTL